ncbi:hypothetical protein [Lysinibacillus sp. NPDC086135]|uniref:hypothetical protein n=1 Tax=Lysinibacillus sp. NPDC086135 TaxID=3364130 RepID=UPI0037F6DB51
MTVNELLKVTDEEQYVWIVVDTTVEFDGYVHEIDKDKYGDKIVNSISFGGTDIMAIVIK